jgi:RNA polymerase sigma factor (sigma-70 family)
LQASAEFSDAFIRLVREHERLIQKVAGLYASDAEDRKDLAGEIVLQLWRAFPRFRGTAKESTWLYRVALNTAITRQRSDQRKPPLSFGDELVINIPDIVDTADAEIRRMHAAIAALPQLERALTLLHLEDRSHAEIAEIMGISVSNVGTRLSRIREKLRKIMIAENS